MDLKKKEVTLWNDSWFNLLYSLRKSEHLMDSVQHISVTKKDENGNSYIDHEPVHISLSEIIKEIALQVGMDEALDELLTEEPV